MYPCGTMPGRETARYDPSTSSNVSNGDHTFSLPPTTRTTDASHLSTQTRSATRAMSSGQRATACATKSADGPAERTTGVTVVATVASGSVISISARPASEGCATLAGAGAAAGAHATLVEATSNALARWTACILTARIKRSRGTDRKAFLPEQVEHLSEAHEDLEDDQQHDRRLEEQRASRRVHLEELRQRFADGRELDLDRSVALGDFEVMPKDVVQALGRLVLPGEVRFVEQGDGVNHLHLRRDARRHELREVLARRSELAGLRDRVGELLDAIEDRLQVFCVIVDGRGLGDHGRHALDAERPQPRQQDAVEPHLHLGPRLDPQREALAQRRVGLAGQVRAEGLHHLL